MVRTQLAYRRRDTRNADRVGDWVSFDTPLKMANRFFGLDLAQHILTFKKQTRMKTVHVVDLGCGSGRTASELKNKLGAAATISATGLARIPAWETWQNTGKINWRVSESEKIAKRFKQGSIDFIYSNVGLSHSRSFAQAIQQVHSILKKMAGCYLHRKLKINCRPVLLKFVRPLNCTKAHHIIFLSRCIIGKKPNTSKF